MNNTNSKEAVKATILHAYTKEEIIIILQKAFNDYNMVDSKMKDILTSTDIKSMEDVNWKLIIEANNILIEYAEKRNKIIEELLNIIH